MITAREIPGGIGLVEQIYDSVPDSTRWGGTLDSVRALMDSCCAVMGIVDTSVDAARFNVVSGEQRLIDPLVNKYGRAVPFYEASPQLELDTPYTVDDLYEIMGPGGAERWLASDITREWVVPNELDDFFWLALMKQSSRTGTLVVIRSRRQRPITPLDRDWMRGLAPHIRRAVTIGDLFESERLASTLFRRLVEALAHAVLIVTSDMRIVFANPAAEALLSERVIARSQNGRLTFSYIHADGAVARAIQIGERDEVLLGGAGINVPLVKASVPAVAHVLPLARRAPEARFAEAAVAGIFISVAGQTPSPAIDAIGALFGLTAAEKRVVNDIASGKSRSDIALSRGVSDGTIKTQLAAIYDKTGTGDRHELEQLIREITPPVASGAKSS